MSDETEAARERTGSGLSGRLRRIGTAGQLLILLVLFNAAALVVFALDRTSRTNGEFCANCHNMTAHVDSYLDSNHLDAAHRRANVGCKDCHADYTMVDEMRSVVAYMMGDYERVFRRRTFKDPMCTGCHIGIEYQAVRTDHLARNPHRGHFPDLRCGACHLAHDRQVNFCARCHDNGGQRMTGQAAYAQAVAPWARFTTPGGARASAADEETGGHDG